MAFLGEPISRKELIQILWEFQESERSSSMPKTTVRGGLFAKYGEKMRRAFEEHKADETDYSSFSRLPAGIDNGVAEVFELRFDRVKEGKQNAGEYFFQARATVKEPKTFKGTKVEGKQTSVFEPMYDTPKRARKTAADHMAWVLNFLRTLGLETENLESDSLEPAMETLAKQGVHVGFRTWVGQATVEFPDPRTNETWEGEVEYDPEQYASSGADEGGTTDDTPPAATAKPGANGEKGGGKATRPSATAPSRPSVASRPKSGKPAPPPEQEADEGEMDEFGSINDLVAKAVRKDPKAQQALTEMAVAAGVSADDVDSAESWDAVAEMIRGASSGGEAEAAEETPAEEEEGGDEPAADEWVVNVGDVYMYKPVDPKTKKQAKKAVEVEVTASDEDGRKVTLKNLDNPKLVYKDISWDALESAG